MAAYHARRTAAYIGYFIIIGSLVTLQLTVDYVLSQLVHWDYQIWCHCSGRVLQGGWPAIFSGFGQIYQVIR
jgi:hypothetical protein